MNFSRCVVLLAVVSLGCPILATSARSDISVGSDGSDGTLVVNTALFVDLSAAATATWDTPSPISGKGVYDPQQWAVVFKYDSVYVGRTGTLFFSNHATRAPVVWLVTRGVRIEGAVRLSGSDGSALGVPATPGPGGFRGGKSSSDLTGGAGAGTGPGGGQYGFPGGGGGGGFGSNGLAGAGTSAGQGGGAYGSPAILPLIGGSGGGGCATNGGTFGGGGGGGGGALLIASGRAVMINGSISADGGQGSYGGGGSGGAIRIVADQLAGGGSLYARGGITQVTGGFGGAGRIRLETNGGTFSGGSNPVHTLHFPVGPTPAVWPPAVSPRVAITNVAGTPAPADPNGNLFGGDLQISSATSVPVTISAANVPANATMILRAVLVSGGLAVTVNATFASGDQSASTWTATLPAVANNGYTLLQARVVLP